MTTAPSRAYFDHPFCSNSKLSALAIELGVSFPIPGDKYEACRMGTLFDAVVTEPQSLDHFRNTIAGTDYTFTKEEYALCKKMFASLQKESIYAQMIQLGVEYQKEIYMPGVPFHNAEYGIDFQLDMRSKLDFYFPPVEVVADLKSTVCTTQSSFENSVEMFGYHRQMVLYCRLTGSKHAIIWGVSKVNQKVFRVHVQPGSEIWMRGEEQLNLLAYKYFMTAA